MMPTWLAKRSSRVSVCFWCFVDSASVLVFPTDNLLKQKWITAIGRVNYKPSPTSVICSNHFGESEFTCHFGSKQLKTRAVPEILKESNNTKQTIDARTVESNSNVCKTTFFIPQYFIVKRDFMTYNYDHDTRRILNSKNLSAPILFGIGNTSTVINAPNVIISSCLKNISTESSNQNLNEIPSDRQETDIDSIPVEEEMETNLPRDPSGSSESNEQVHYIVREESDRAPRRFYFGDCSLEDLKNPVTAKCAWRVIQRTLVKQRTKISNLQATYHALEEQLKELNDDIQTSKSLKTKNDCLY